MTKPKLSNLDPDDLRELERDLESIERESNWLKGLVCQPDSKLKVDLELDVVLGKVEMIKDFADWQTEKLQEVISRAAIKALA